MKISRKVVLVTLVLFCLFGLTVLMVAQQPSTSTSTSEPEEEEIQLAKKGMTVQELFIAGGEIMWPLLFCSVATITLGIYFLFVIREGYIFSKKFHKTVTQYISQGQFDKALALCKKRRGVMGTIIGGMLEAVERPCDKIREVAERRGALSLAGMSKSIEYLNTLGVIAPMLGLLGTVTGMMKAFAVVATKAGLGNPRLLAAGIWEAFITTAAGLPIGIVAFGLYIHFREKIVRITILAADRGEEVIDLIEQVKNRPTGGNV